MGSFLPNVLEQDTACQLYHHCCVYDRDTVNQFVIKVLQNLTRAYNDIFQLTVTEISFSSFSPHRDSVMLNNSHQEETYPLAYPKYQKVFNTTLTELRILIFF